MEKSLSVTSGLGPRLQVLVVAILFSTGGAVIKATAFTGWQIASFRCGIAAIAILVFLPSSRRGWTYRSWLVGCAYGGALITYAMANKLTTAASTIFLYSTAPLYILFLAPVLLKEPMRRRDLLFVVAFGSGLALVFLDTQSASATAPDPVRGNILAAIGGLCFALVVIGLRWLGRAGATERTSAASSLVAGNLIAFVVCLPAALPIVEVTGLDWGLVIYLGVFQVGLTYVLFSRALRRVRALEASLLLLIEPVLNPIWAWWLHDEEPSRRVILGGAVILITTATMTLVAARQARQKYQEASSVGQ